MLLHAKLGSWYQADRKAGPYLTLKWENMSTPYISENIRRLKRKEEKVSPVLGTKLVLLGYKWAEIREKVWEFMSPENRVTFSIWGMSQERGERLKMFRHDIMFIAKCNVWNWFSLLTTNSSNTSSPSSAAFPYFHIYQMPNIITLGTNTDFRIYLHLLHSHIHT